MFQYNINNVPECFNKMTAQIEYLNHTLATHGRHLYHIHSIPDKYDC